MVMGDLVLLESEIAPVMTTLIQRNTTIPTRKSGFQSSAANASATEPVSVGKVPKSFW